MVKMCPGCMIPYAWGDNERMLCCTNITNLFRLVMVDGGCRVESSADSVSSECFDSRAAF